MSNGNIHDEPHTLLAAILQTAVDAIIVIDPRGKVQLVNPATETLFGYPATEVIGNNVSMLMPAPYHDEHDSYLEHYHQTGERKIIGIGREVVGLRKDGTTFPMHLAVSEINVGDRKLFAGIVRDITDLKQAERQLTEMNVILEQRVEQRTAELREAQAGLLRAERLATLGQVSGGIAHEIRNPLNAVKTSAYYLLNANDPSPAKTREHLQRIDKQVTLIDNVVTALSDVARLPEPSLRACDISEILLSVAESVRLNSQISIVHEIPNDLRKALVDANQIPIVFRNLIRNAGDAMPTGGTITLSAANTNGHVTIHVTDTGTGIAAEHLPHITEPLYSTKARGMGLGLAISNAIVEKNGGTLKVESELGKGTTFSVVLQAVSETTDTTHG